MPARRRPGRIRVTRLGGALAAAVVAGCTALPLGPAGPAAAVAQSAPGGRLAIGDSVMLGAKPQLTGRGFRVDAEVSRQFPEAASLLRAYGASLPRNVVVHLGTNGTITLAHCRSVVRAAGTDRRVFLVTNKVPRRWQDGNNAALRSCDASFPGDRVVLVDWYGASRNRPAYFAGDGYHLTGSGAAAYSTMVDSAVDANGL